MPQRSSNSKNFPIVGIGASAGGYEAFMEFLKAIPSTTRFAFVFVQHQDPTRESNLAELLSRVSPMPVYQVTERQRIEPNSVYIIPPNSDMTIEKGLFRLTPRRADRRPHLPIDLFFQSLAEYSKRQAIGVVLSGTASDGTLGLQAIKAAGGITFAQDEESAKYAGMPHNAVASDVVDFVLPPDQIAREIGKFADHPLVKEEVLKELSTASTPALTNIFQLLRKTTEVDFSQYKPSTVMRRMNRRMLLHGMDSLDKYWRFLKENPRQVNSLYEDILINVTQFFREPETFETLKNEVFSKALLSSKDRVFRAWVPGCSTGEEAYSVAIAFQEFCSSRGRNAAIQVFGTDISERSVEQARAGQYPFSIAAHVSPERLRRFFIKTDHGYQIIKSIRDVCIFARHNVVKDPPFSRIDLLSCRNLLIYLGPVLQKKLLPIFHYALNTNGYLLLGSSETIGGFSDYFFPADRKYKIYARKSAPRRPHFELAADFGDIRPATGMQTVRPAEAATPKDILREGDRLILSRYAPASVIVDENFDILQFRGQTGPYLEPASGQASLSIMKMAKEGLVKELRSALLQARKEKIAVQKKGLQLHVNGDPRTFDLEVSPYSVPRSSQYFYLVFFEDTSKSTQRKKQPKPAPPSKQGAEVTRLRSELTSTRDYLQSIIEEQEATNEELRAANEEILSSNEELQSTNEEMETAKEELQSANEELITVNEELQIRNVELNRLNDDLTNLLASVFIPIVMLDRDLRIRLFTPMAEKVFNLIPSDVGRPISDINMSISVPNLYDELVEVIDSIVIKTMDVQDKTSRWYNLQIRPYKTTDNKIDGAVLALIDVDSLKRTDGGVPADKLQEIAETLHEPVILLDNSLRIKVANSEFLKVFRAFGHSVYGRPFFDVAEEWNLPNVKAVVERLLNDQETGIVSVTLENELDDGGKRKLNIKARPLKVDDGETMVLLAIRVQ